MCHMFFFITPIQNTETKEDHQEDQHCGALRRKVSEGRLDLVFDACTLAAKNSISVPYNYE